MEQWGQYMDLHDSLLKKAYAPYRKEALHCAGLALVITIVGFLSMLLINLHQIAPILFLIFPLYWLAEILINCRLSIYSFWEARKREYVTTTATIIQIRTENAVSAHWGSAIPQLYPKQLRVDRYKIVGYDDSGNKVFFRCVMSGKKWQLLSDNVQKGSSLERKIIYGKYSRIIILWSDKDDLAHSLNHMF